MEFTMMRLLRFWVSVLVFTLCLSGSFAYGNITISTVPVGNAGNSNDSTGFGAVSYSYRIGTFEVTNDQYAAFLNSKAASDPFGLYNASMGSDVRGGIIRSGVSGSVSYATKLNMENKPVNYVSWYDTIRFVNWLNSGQGSADTETGAYTLGTLGPGGVPINGNSINRNSNSNWFLPSQNEWYKAAYHKNDGTTANYFAYPTGSNSIPTMAGAIDAAGPMRGDVSNPMTNVANFNKGADWNNQNGNVTTVGSAGPASASRYLTYDQGGNVSELIEDFRPDPGFPGRGSLGGDWTGEQASMRYNNANGTNVATAEINYVGFRVARTLLPPLPGDYNGDGGVDAADYTVWRDKLGSMFNLNGNGDETGGSAGVVDQADYAYWKSNFGHTSGSGSLAIGSVPEPATLALAVLGLVGGLLGLRRRTRC
jgi:formylglycine-generating enzyme required for sulfatase activity